MKRLLLAIYILACAGCATITRDVTNQVALVRDSFNGLLPDNFSGPVDLSRADTYVTLTLKATNVHKDSTTGKWVWTSVHYHRSSSIPWFAGMTWKSEVDINLGTPTQ